ncbi:LacI family DNA-binding transcriptional regulator [Merdibacter massiliensis]|uniref:LacI family DNA-binding transcriptional regulator n=1 Tax=Merdibacter massiliensis TaxID=1871030 RepID=UPI001F20476E|nr:LacI family DNA-binding transcriptional regulator [Merdibacter massiliensis]
MGTVRKITMKEIAQLSGVGKSTVSRYFNGGYVKEETRQKIASVIQQYNYEPNTFARLKAKSSKMIGIIAPCLDSVVTSQVLMSIDRHLRQEGYSTMIINTDHQEELELQYLEKLWRMNVDGLILSATHLSEKHYDLLSQIDIPVVVVAQNYRDGVCIINDDYYGGKFVGNYIGLHHHHQVACLCVDTWDEAVGVVRRQGIIDGLKESGVSDPYIYLSDFSFAHACEQVNRILEEHTIDALICSTDRQALGAYKVIREHGLRIPQDISIISFGGYDISELITPRLTTVRFDSEYSGKCCARTILRMINGEEVQPIQYVNYTFIEGESVK